MKIDLRKTRRERRERGVCKKYKKIIDKVEDGKIRRPDGKEEEEAEEKEEEAEEEDDENEKVEKEYQR